MKQYIQDQRIPQQDDVINFSSLSTTLENSGPGKLLKPFLDNPIVHEILHFASKWILNASCLVDDVLSLPGADSITKLTADLAQKIDQLILDEGNTFVRFFNDLIAKFKDVLAGRRNLGEFFTVLLSDAFWTVFDAIDAVAEAFLDIFAELISTILDVFSGVIKIPGVSAFWEALNGTKFSILNVLSMQLAHIMYLITMLWKEKLPFDLMSPWADLLPDPDKIILTNSKPPSGAAISEDKKHSHLGGIAADPSTSQLTPVSINSNPA